jgi:hypothetical protein
MDLWSVDLVGPIRPTSLGSAVFFLTVVDIHSRRYFVFPLKSKADVPQVIIDLIVQKEVETGMKLKRLRSDNELIFRTGLLNDFCSRQGIRREFSPNWTPQGNSFSERAHGVLLAMARTLLADVKLPEEYWSLALVIASYIHNVTPCTALPNNAIPASHGGKIIDRCR